VLIPVFVPKERREAIRRVRSLILFGLTVVIAVAAFYSPAYLLRGMMFLDKAGFDNPSFQVWLYKLPGVLAEAANWWLAFPWPIQLVAALCFLIGLASVARARTQLLALLAPFIFALILICVQQVSPPPRVFLYLAPWAILICSQGLVTIAERFPQPSRTMTVLSAAIVLCGLVYLVGRPYLFEEHERKDYASIPAAIARLQTEFKQSAAGSHRLFAPLPCDLPSIYYMEKFGFRIPVNGDPQLSENLWLLARPDQTPSETLRTPLIGLSALSDQLGPWNAVATFDTLVLYRLARPASTDRTPGF
jgi:hypothetical protein